MEEKNTIMLLQNESEKQVEKEPPAEGAMWTKVRWGIIAVVVQPVS